MQAFFELRCVFLVITLIEPTKVIARKTQGNAENACVNGDSVWIRYLPQWQQLHSGHSIFHSIQILQLLQLQLQLRYN